jgi:hypothetical protein
MAECQAFRDNVDRLREFLETHDCQDIEDINERKRCLQARGQIREQLEAAEAGLRNCEAGLPPPGIWNASGTLTFLRVHDSGGYGPANDHLDGEVVFRLNSEPERAFGFRLRNDDDGPAHRGMLALLRDAFTNGFTVHTDYRQELNKTNSVAFRVWITR